MFEPERIEKLAELLRRTSEAHREAFAATDGADPDWPTWFAKELEEPLEEILHARLDQETLAGLLQEAEQEHVITSPGREWALYYAEFLIARVM